MAISTWRSVAGRARQTAIVLLVLAATTAVSAAAADLKWHPKDPTKRPSPRRKQHARKSGNTPKYRGGAKASPELSATTMSCMGDADYERACLLQDIYYDTRTRTFTWEHIDEAKDGDEFDVVWSSESPPDPTDTCTITLPVHLRREGPVGTGSYGHLLRDNLYFLILLAERFGADPGSFTWVMWPRSRGDRAQRPNSSIPRLSPLVSHSTSRRWDELEVACKNRNNQLGPDTVAAAPRYIHLTQALMSGASFMFWSTSEKKRLCRWAEFHRMRDHAQRINSIRPRPARRPSDRILMSVILKPPEDKRQLIVPPEVLAAVRRTFPQIDIELHTAAHEDEAVQLRWLSRTDILVTNVGSASFRMIYLPNGAQVIMAGPLEVDYADEEGLVTNVDECGGSFRELISCWDDVDYFTVHRYHITTAKDIVFKPLPEGRARTSSKERRAAVRIRDSDVILRPRQLLSVLEEAVAQLGDTAARLQGQ